MPISCKGRLGDRMLMTIRAPTIQKRENLLPAPPQELQKRLMYCFDENKLIELSIYGTKYTKD